MSLRRFLVEPGALAQGETISLDQAEAAHARKVLRLSAGDEVGLLDGAGARAVAAITRLDKNGMQCLVGPVESVQPIRPRLVLCPGLAKGPAMDTAAVKLTELAADEVRPFIARRSEGRLNDPAARLERWERLARQALKQCGAPRAPRFFPPEPLAELLARRPGQATGLLLYERSGGASLAKAMADAAASGEFWVLIGPEGGFEPEEAEAAVAAGFRACHLPGTILRAETACLAAAAIIRFGAQWPATAADDT